MKYRLELNNISKSFGDVHANKNINFYWVLVEINLKKGEIQAILAHSKRNPEVKNAEKSCGSLAFWLYRDGCYPFICSLFQ